MQHWSWKHSFTQSHRFFLCCRLHTAANTFWNQSPDRRTLLHLRDTLLLLPLQILFEIILQLEGHHCTAVAVVFTLSQFDISHTSFFTCFFSTCCIPDANYECKDYVIIYQSFFLLFFWHHYLLAMQPTATFLLDRRNDNLRLKKGKKLKKSIETATSTPHV